jgi:hypothetical protein
VAETKANAAQEYTQSFSGEALDDKSKARKALDLALDIRKFEIGLYWQRAAYFWALIAAAFAGYFAILGSDKLEDKNYLAYIVSCIGIAFTWAWYLVNRGSKYWQENWENHVDMLEDEIVGPLYKTILHRPSNRPFTEKHILGPRAISVSKINLLVSIFTLYIWAALVAHALPPISLDAPLSWKHIAIGAVTIIFMITCFSARTNLGSHEYIVTKRKTWIGGPVE